MPKTSIKERNKAIRLAWEREQKLVAEGKGTRDWSQDQQKDILDPEKGKAYDENGRAFEGQHMKSAAEYSEYQGDPDNIQFLSRDEHLEAHKGSWQNPTNWYYNPETKEFVDFGDNKPTPCAPINLSEPVCSPVIESQNNSEKLQTVKHDTTSTEHTKPSRQEDVSHHSENISQKNPTVAPPETHEGIGDKNKISHIFDVANEFGKKHPVLTGALKAAGYIIAGVGAIYLASESGGGSSSSSSEEGISGSSDDDYSDYSSSDELDSPSSSRDYPDERSSPAEHTVPAHGQHYRTKDGLIWKEKEPYQRGGKHDDD